MFDSGRDIPAPLAERAASDRQRAGEVGERHADRRSPGAPARPAAGPRGRAFDNPDARGVRRRNWPSPIMVSSSERGTAELAAAWEADVLGSLQISAPLARLVRPRAPTSRGCCFQAARRASAVGDVQQRAPRSHSERTSVARRRASRSRDHGGRARSRPAARCPGAARPDQREPSRAPVSRLLPDSRGARQHADPAMVQNPPARRRRGSAGVAPRPAQSAMGALARR